MKKIKCLSTGGYKLTVDKEYDVLREEEGFYIIVNDKNRTQRYSSGFFEIIEEEVVVVVEEPVKKTEDELIASIRIEGGSVVFDDFDGETIELSNKFSTTDRLSASCGIGDVEGIDATYEKIQSKLNGADYNDDDYLKLRKELFKACVIQYIKVDPNESRGAYILSTALQNVDDWVIEVLDEISETTSNTFNNPNSGNIIKFWTIYR